MKKVQAGAQVKLAGRVPEASGINGAGVQMAGLQQLLSSGKVHKITCGSKPSFFLLNTTTKTKLPQTLQKENSEPQIKDPENITITLPPADDQLDLQDSKNAEVTRSSPRDYELDHKVTMRLLELYKQNRSKVGTHTLRSFKRLWEIIAVDINQSFETEYTASQIENKWRVLERKYKKVHDSSNRGGRVFPYRKEMDEIFPKKNGIINPELLLDTNVMKYVDVVMENDIASVEPENEETISKHQPPVGSNTSTLTVARKVRKVVRRRRGEKLSENDVLMMIRKDKKQYYDNCARIQEEKLALDRERLREKTRKNDLSEQLNALLKQYLDANIKIPDVL